MERLDSLLLTTEKQVELIIRGGGSSSSNQHEESLVTKNMYNLFEHLNSAALNRECAAVEDKNLRVTAAVRLHNKVRNLAPVAHAELRAVAKACSAWMLMLFNQPTPKSLCAVIKLLSRAGQETEPYSVSISLKCVTATMELWSKLSINSLSQIMAQLELQDVKIAVFQAYLKKANILMTRKSMTHLSSISGAFDLVQLLPDGLKIHFAEEAVMLGTQLSGFDKMEEAAHMLQIAVSSISLLSQTDGRETLSLQDKEGLRALKVKALLSLAFVYKELNQCDKAMISILEVESTLQVQAKTAKGDVGLKDGSDAVKNMLQTVAYAKFTILARDQDWETAEQCLQVLLQSAPYDLAMEVTRVYLEGNQNDTNAKGIELYRFIAKKYPSKPEFTNTRICLVQYLLSSAQLFDDATDQKGKHDFISKEVPSPHFFTGQATIHRRVLELCSEIVGDHSSSKTILKRSFEEGGQSVDNQSYDRVKRILSERIRWTRSSCDWNSVIKWIDLMLALLKAVPGEIESDQMLDDRIIVQLQKVDAFIHLEQVEDAQKLAQNTVQQVCVTRTIVMMFLATLHARGALVAVDTLSLAQAEYGLRANTIDESLTQIMMCAEMAKDADKISSYEKELTIIKLLESWLARFSLSQAWRHELPDDSVTEVAFPMDVDTVAEPLDTAINYFSVACELLSRYLKMNLRKVPFEYSQPQPILKGDSIAPTKTYENTSAEDCETSQPEPILKAGSIGSTETCKSAPDKKDISKGTDQDFCPIKSPKEKRPRDSDEVASIAVQYSDENDENHQIWVGKRNKVDNFIDLDQKSPPLIAQNAIQNDVSTADNKAEGATCDVDDEVLRSPPSLFDSEKVHEEISPSEDTTAPRKMAQTHSPDYDQDVSVPCENMLIQSDLISDASMLQEDVMAEVTGSTGESIEVSHSITHAINIHQPENKTLFSAIHLQSNSNLGDSILQLIEPTPKIELTISSSEPPPKIEPTIEISEDFRIQSAEVVRIFESPPAEKEILDTITLPIKNILEGNSSTEEKISQKLIKGASALKLYTSLCDTSTTGIPLTTPTNTDLDESERTSTFSYHFKQSLFDVKSVLLGSLRSVIQLQHLLLQCGGDFASLGTYANLEWMGDISWNLGCIMLSENNCHSVDVFSEIPFSASISKAVPVEGKSTDMKSNQSRMARDIVSTASASINRELRIAGAEFLEVAADIYALIPFADQQVGSKNQGMCMVLACSARLDAATFEDIHQSHISRYDRDSKVSNDASLKLPKHLVSDPKDYEQDISMIEITPMSLFRTSTEIDQASKILGPDWAEKNLYMARDLARAAIVTLASASGFDDIEDDTRYFLRKVALVLEFSSLCKIQSGELQGFVESEEAQFLMLSAPQLKICSEIASNEKGGSVEVARKMLNFSLQICQRDLTPDYKLMGQLFRKLIELSPSRGDALDRVRHFEQLANGQAHSENVDEEEDSGIEAEPVKLTKECPFDPSDVDYVASISFNYGLSLMDMNQIDLAEVFVSKAISLLPHASQILMTWTERMQDTYMTVLKVKETHHRKEKEFASYAKMQ